MAFLNTFFLYFLALAAVPLVISLILNINKKREQFPSLDFIMTILKRELENKRIRMRLKQVLRALVFLAIILAFASPVVSRGADSGEWTVIVDDSVSMSRFDLGGIVLGLKEQYKIGKVYFGMKPVLPEALNEGKLPAGYDFFGESTFPEKIAAVLASDPAVRLILISDAQKSSTGAAFKLPSGTEEVKFVLTADTNRNIYVSEVSVFPMVGLPDVKSVLSVKIGGKIVPGDRVKIAIGGETVLSEQAKPVIEISRFVNQSGIGFGEVVLEGDGFIADNTNYFPVVASAVPSVYSDIQSPVIGRILSSLFPKFYMTQSPHNADLIMAGYLPKQIADKPVLLFCEDADRFGRVLQRDFKIFCQFAKKSVTGDISSKYSVLEIVKAFSIMTAFEPIPGEVAVKAGDTPLVYQLNNYSVFNFSIGANEDVLSSSVFLLLTVSEIFMENFRGKYLMKEKADGVYYGLGGTIMSPDTPGVYRYKDDGKFLIRNTGAESEFEFYSPGEIEDKLGVSAEIIGVSGTDIKLPFFRWEFALALMICAVVLLTAETVLIKS
ncbi:MAG: hypothetical protein A2Y33_09495 [Spirochaetes bacterium GWF1_51_8]|nr:MAG: hypothetical protein A2Y33_09495 [Spirochaetes bacterium GWF1_51_8]